MLQPASSRSREHICNNYEHRWTSIIKMMMMMMMMMMLLLLLLVVMMIVTAITVISWPSTIIDSCFILMFKTKFSWNTFGRVQSLILRIPWSPLWIRNTTCLESPWNHHFAITLKSWLYRLYKSHYIKPITSPWTCHDITILFFFKWHFYGISMIFHRNSTPNKSPWNETMSSRRCTSAT